MATKTLVIDGGDRDHFFLAVDRGTLRVGDDPAHPGGVVRGLRVVRIHCEVDVDDDHDAVRIDAADGSSLPRELGPTGAIELGRARMSLVASAGTNPRVPAAPSPAAPVGVSRRLVVIDGADRGQTYRLPAVGTVTVGKPGKGVDVGLDDLYVARVHCRLAVDAGGVTVSHVEGQNGTLIDGRRIERPEPLLPGSVLRVGNSHLRVETGVFAEEPPTPTTPNQMGEGSGIHRPSGLTKPTGAATRTGDGLSQLDGQTLGHYRLGTLIGRGFVGAVFRGTDMKTDQPVALKVLSAEFPTSAAELERFSRAVRDAQPVRHPNLVTLLGAGKAGPHCWIAREYVEGESAADVIGRIAAGDKPSWSRSARVAVHLARVLDCLHGRKLIHGNITPRNVLIRKGDHATKLADLCLGSALDGSTLRTTVSEKKRNAELPYTAPELLDSGVVASELSDLYAVGVLAYALIVGRSPFGGGTADAVRDAVRQGRPTRPSAAYRKVPAAFDAVVMKLLARTPDERYPSPAALLEDLEPLAQIHEIKV